MEKLYKVINIAGYIWVVISIMYILYRYGMLLIFGEAPFINRVLSFINMWNIFFALIIFSPGIICILLSDHFENKKGDKID